MSPEGPVKQGGTVKVTCTKPEHYVLIGRQEITCQSDGSWSPEIECRKCGKVII